MLRIWNRLRICLLIIIALTTAAFVAGVFYLSEVGLNQAARDRIALELERYNLYVSFQDLTYDFSNGLTAKQVKLFTSEERDNLMAELPHLVIDIDRTKFIRGRLKVNKVALKNADLSLPLNKEQKDGIKLVVSNITGAFYFPNTDSIETDKLTATWQGLDFTVQGHVWQNSDSKEDPKEEDKPNQTEENYQKLIETISQWDWKKSNPPNIVLTLEGDLNDLETFHTAFQVNSPEIQYKGYPLHEVQLKGDFTQGVLTLDKIQFQDDVGQLQGKGDFLPSSQEGRFELESSVDFQRASRTFLKTPLLPQLRITGQHNIVTKGNFQLKTETSPSLLHLSGHLSGNDFQYLGKRFDTLNTKFSYKDKAIYLNDLNVKIQDKELKGKLLAQKDIVRYKFYSDLPVNTYQPFIEGTPIMYVLRRCKFNKNSKVTLDLEGTMDRSNMTDWSTLGNLKVSNFSYNDVPLKRLQGTIALNALLSRYQKIEAEFDYQNYSLKKAHGGPSSAIANVKEIEFDRTNKTVTIKDVSGKFWPSPFIRMFQKYVANHVENYQFTRPPTVTASGVFDLSKQKTGTDFRVSVDAPEKTYYKFLNRNIALTRLKTKVNITKKSVSLPSLSFHALDGPISGNLKVLLGSNTYSGFLKWTEIPLASLNRTYQFSKDQGKGTLIGNIYFSGKSNQLSSFNAKSGNISLRKGTLFTVPIVGPLSPLIGQTIGTIIGNKRILHEEAKDASCSFIIKNGVIYTNDFTSHTSSMNFTGHGAIDLNKKTIDVTARMNIRGLLGFITLPLRPFTNTLFQYRGQGKINDPSWAPAPFQAPPKDHPLFRKPPKATIVQ